MRPFLVAAPVAALGLGFGVLLAKERAVEVREATPPRTALVVGGGVIGVSTAYQLARRGVQVTLLEERDQLAQVASYCNGAILCQSMAASWASARLMAENPGEVKRMRVSLAAWLDPRFWRWAAWFWLNSLVPGWAEYNHQSHRLLALHSLVCQQEEEDRLGEKGGCARTAVETLRLFHDQREMDQFLQSDQAQFWSSHGHPFSPLSAEECCRLEPCLAEPSQSGLVGGVRCSVDSSGEVHLYTSRLAEAARELGVDIKCGQKVTRLSVQNGRVSGVELECGTSLQADIYILAAGVASPALAAGAGVNLPVYPLKGHMATVEFSGGGPRRNIYSPRQGLASPLGAGVRIAGGVEAVGWDFTVEEDKGRRVMEGLREVFTQGVMQEAGAKFHSCLRPVSGDDVAIIGRSRIDNLWVNTGHGSKGWTYSWGAASLLAQLVMGQEPELEGGEERFSPLRFHPVRRFLGLC